MENENQPLQPAGPPISPQPQATDVTTKWRNPYETILLIFGCIAVFSLLTGNGGLLKVAAVIFLILGLFTIARGIPLRGEAVPVSSPAGSPKVKRPWTPLRIIGLSVLILVVVPIIGFIALILFFIIAFSTGNVRMGT